jgi:Domain of unknown function (DUF5615)
VRLLLDEHLSPTIARALRSRGHDVVALPERYDLRGLGDSRVFEAATKERRAVVTLDAGDFRPVAREALAAGQTCYGLVLVSPAPSARGAPLLAALDRLLRELPGDDDIVRLRGGEVWLRLLD